MHEEHIKFQNSRNETLTAVIHDPQNASGIAVIVLHGFGGNKDKCWIIDMCNALGRAGIAGVRMDFAGNGESEGRFEEMTYPKMVSDLRSCINYLETKGFSMMGIVGHSMGGAVAILAGSEDPRIKTVVNIAGVAYPAVEKHIQLVKNYFDTCFDKPLPSAGFISNLRSVDVIGAVRRLHVPILTIHGDADDVVPILEGEAINEAANEPKKMIIAIGSGHRLSQDAAFASECIELSVEWMGKYL